MIAKTGRFELDGAKFKAHVKKTDKDSHALDFKIIFPDFFNSTDKMPRLLDKIWRQTADTFLETEKGYYCFQEKGCLVHFTFENAVKSMAKVKVDMIGKAIQKNLETATKRVENQSTVSNETANKTDQTDKKIGGDENLKKVLEGLRVNPSMSEVKLWANRALQNLHLSNTTPKEIITLQEEYKICYVPFWNADSNVLVGASSELNPRGTSTNDEGQLIRDNIAIFAAARREMKRLVKENKKAIIAVPIYIKPLMEKDVGELLLTLLKKTPEVHRKAMIFELRDVQQNKIPSAVKGVLQTISQLSRALIVDTGILAPPDIDPNLKVHSYGCNFNEMKLPPAEMLGLMKKYAHTYKKHGMRTYIKNLPNAFAIEKAQEFGFTYISSPAVLRPGLSCPAATRMSIADIKSK